MSKNKVVRQNKRLNKRNSKLNETNKIKKCSVLLTRLDVSDFSKSLNSRKKQVNFKNANKVNANSLNVKFKEVNLEYINDKSTILKNCVLSYPIIKIEKLDISRINSKQNVFDHNSRDQKNQSIQVANNTDVNDIQIPKKRAVKKKRPNVGRPRKKLVFNFSKRKYENKVEDFNSHENKIPKDIKELKTCEANSNENKISEEHLLGSMDGKVYGDVLVTHIKDKGLNSKQLNIVQVESNVSALENPENLIQGENENNDFVTYSSEQESLSTCKNSASKINIEANQSFSKYENKETQTPKFFKRIIKARRKPCKRLQKFGKKNLKRKIVRNEKKENFKILASADYKATSVNSENIESFLPNNVIPAIAESTLPFLNPKENKLLKSQNFEHLENVCLNLEQLSYNSVLLNQNQDISSFLLQQSPIFSNDLLSYNNLQASLVGNPLQIISEVLQNNRTKEVTSIIPADNIQNYRNPNNFNEMDEQNINQNIYVQPETNYTETQQNGKNLNNPIVDKYSAKVIESIQIIPSYDPLYHPHNLQNVTQSEQNNISNIFQFCQSLDSGSLICSESISNIPSSISTLSNEIYDEEQQNTIENALGISRQNDMTVENAIQENFALLSQNNIAGDYDYEKVKNNGRVEEENENNSSLAVEMPNILNENAEVQMNENCDNILECQLEQEKCCHIEEEKGSMNTLILKNIENEVDNSRCNASNSKTGESSNSRSKVNISKTWSIKKDARMVDENYFSTKITIVSESKSNLLSDEISETSLEKADLTSSSSRSSTRLSSLSLSFLQTTNINEFIEKSIESEEIASLEKENNNCDSDDENDSKLLSAFGILSECRVNLIKLDLKDINLTSANDSNSRQEDVQFKNKGKLENEKKDFEQVTGLKNQYENEQEIINNESTINKINYTNAEKIQNAPFEIKMSKTVEITQNAKLSADAAKIYCKGKDEQQITIEIDKNFFASTSKEFESKNKQNAVSIQDLLSPEYSNDSESSQSNKNPIENESSTDRTSVSEEPSESSNGNEAERDNNVLLQKGAEPKDTLIAIENNELLLRKEKRNANDERIEKNKINNEEILEIIDFEKDFEIEGELSSLHDNNTNNVNSIIIKRKSDFVENNENKISNSQNFLPFKKRYIKKIARKKKLTASKNSNRTKRINRPVFETSPHGNQNLINSCLDRPIEIEILSQAQVHEISSTQISPPHNDINLQSHPAQQLEQSHELGDVSEQINHITNVQENEPEESEQETVPREQYENLTVDLYYDSAFTDVELLAENIVKKQITEDLSRERKRKQFQPRKQQEKIISTESSSAASSSSSSISSISSFNNMSKSGHRSNKNKNSRKKNSKTDINNVQGEQFFRSQAGTNENADDEFRTGLAETTETESNSSKKLFRPLLEKKKKGISKANEAIDETNEKNEIKKVDFHNLFTGYFELEPLKDRKKKEIDEMNSKADSFETYRRNLCSHDCSEKVIQCDNVTSSNLNEREIENMLGISHNTGDLFGDCNKSTSMVNSPTKIIVEDAKSKKMELPMKKFRIRVNKNFSKILQADTIPKERSFSIESKQKGTKLVKEENECQINNISENREIYTIKKSPCKFLHAEKENILGISYNRKDLIVNCNKSKIQSPTKMINKDGKPKNLKPEIKELRIKVDRNLSKILKERSCNRKLEQKEKDLMEHEYNREIIKTSEKQEICNTRKDAPRKFFQNSEKSPFEKKFYTKSKSVKKKGNVQTSGKQSKSSSIFDFTASQSSPSNSDDPTKDVIKDLIKAGRVEVVKYKKGSGKLKTKFKKPKLCKKQICEDGSKRAVTNPAQNTNNIAKEVDFEAFKNANNNDNGFDNDIFMSEEVSRNNTNSLNGLARRGIKNRATQNPYSRLIVNSRKVKDKKVLLALAKSFIRRSEEMNKNQSVLTKTKKLSSNDQIGSASPWRVEEDLPSLFNFSRNSENLPSFSSDVINPPSPQQNKNQVLRSSRNFSLNKSLDNSNIENIQPAFENSNLNIETNPKKGKIHRSPLKQINIIDIINLPLLSNNNSTPIHRPAVFNPFSPLEYNSQNALFKKPTTELKNPTAGEEITSLFGFDRDIEEESAENIETVSLDLKNSKKNLHKKLKKLKRLVPNNNLREVNEVSKPTRLFNIKTIRPIFEDTTKTFQQKNIPQMLSYTKSKTGKKYDEKNYDPVDLNISSEESGKEIQNKNIENEPTLFEIENIPLQASNSIRTYEKSKRKRPKTRHNFVLYNDTDSDKESDAEQPKKKKKKHRNEPKQNEELKSFYNDFNNMCAEIEKYNLVVE